MLEPLYHLLGVETDPPDHKPAVDDDIIRPLIDRFPELSFTGDNGVDVSFMPFGEVDAGKASHAYAVPYVWIWGEEANRTGVNLHMSSVERISERAVDPRCKNFHWGDLLHAKRDAYAADCDDAALCGPDGFLAEGPGFNIFVIKDGRVATPDSNCLEGVSREAAIELCEMEEIPIECRKVRPEELSEADEAFATSTAGGIIPIVRIDGVPLGNGAPGLTTSRLAELYWSRREAGWCGRRVGDLIAR